MRSERPPGGYAHNEGDCYVSHQIENAIPFGSQSRARETVISLVDSRVSENERRLRNGETVTVRSSLAAFTETDYTRTPNISFFVDQGTAYTTGDLKWAVQAECPAPPSTSSGSRNADQ